jgi:hypothetical protein
MIVFAKSDEDCIFEDAQERADWYHNILYGNLEPLNEILESVCKDDYQRRSVLYDALYFIVKAKWEFEGNKDEYNGHITTKILLSRYKELGGKKFFLCASCRANEIDFETVKYLYEVKNWDGEEIGLAIWWANYRSEFEDKGHSMIRNYLRKAK